MLGRLIDKCRTQLSSLTTTGLFPRALPRLAPCCYFHYRVCSTVADLEGCTDFLKHRHEAAAEFRAKFPTPPQETSSWWNPFRILSGAYKRQHEYEDRIEALVKFYTRWNAAMMLLHTCMRDEAMLSAATAIEASSSPATALAIEAATGVEFPFHRMLPMPDDAEQCDSLIATAIVELNQSYAVLLRSLGLDDADHTITPSAVVARLEALYPSTHDPPPCRCWGR